METTSMSEFPANDNSCPQHRRQFVKNSIRFAGMSTLLAIPGINMAKSLLSTDKTYLVQDVIDIILKEIPGAPFKDTVDTIKSGSQHAIVQGIVTTMFATVDVIEQCAQLKANFIIAHEPTFYNHTDDINWVPGNSIVKRKRELLEKNNITVWRFHDYWHSHKPDGIGYGVLKKTGWLSHYNPGESVVTIPGTSLKDVIVHLKKSLNIPHVRVIGDLSQQCQRVALLPGAAGGQMQMSLVENQKPDLLIVGEVHEWETAEYIRDGRLMGSKTALVVLGHSVSEEPGMEYLVDWLQPKVPEIKITHLPSNNPFQWF